jgi:hypothetical protein
MTTRLDIRNWIAQRIGDYKTGNVADPLLGSMSYVTISDFNITELDEDYWKDASVTVEFVGTTSTGRVSGYVPSTSCAPGGVLSIYPTLSLVPSTNTAYHLHRKFNIAEYNLAINGALRECADIVEVARSYSSLSATGSMVEYALPTSANIHNVVNVYYLDDDNYNWPYKIDPRNWVVRMQGNIPTLTFFSTSTVPAGKVIRVEGSGPPASLDTDNATLDAEVPTEYVINKAAAMLRLSLWRGQDPDDNSRVGVFLEQKADGLLRRAKPFSRIGHIQPRKW